ncbi:MAG: hypothetical protein PHE36_06750 [Novosphingobium sp.]|nr:hypothetical protein [Novosphingobium sp.]
MTLPLSLPVADWPATDRRIWEEARTPMRFDKRARIAGRWSDRRCRIVCQGYGQWLSWLARKGALYPAEAPEARATQPRIASFVRQLQARITPWSVTMMVQGLQAMLKVMAPDHDWRWLATVVSNLKRIATPERDKRPHMVEPRQLYDLGLDLMMTARARAADGDYHAATMGRDGLLIALLICCPVRIANLTIITLGRHLVETDEGYSLRFSPEETKNGRPIEAGVPAELAAWIDIYLATHRPALLARGHHGPCDSLWISRWGAPMQEHAVRDQICKRTAAAFGAHVWPHLFRAIAATGMVDHAPEQAGLLPDLLGHGNVQTSQRHYVLSAGTQAHKAVQDTLYDLRKAASARLRQAGRKAP